MAISVSCSCGRGLKVPDHFVGKIVMCPYCSEQFLVADPNAGAEDAPPVAEVYDDEPPVAQDYEDGPDEPPPVAEEYDDGSDDEPPVPEAFDDDSSDADPPGASEDDGLDEEIEDEAPAGETFLEFGAAPEAREEPGLDEVEILDESESDEEPLPAARRRVAPAPAPAPDAPVTAPGRASQSRRRPGASRQKPIVLFYSVGTCLLVLAIGCPTAWFLLGPDLGKSGATPEATGGGGKQTGEEKLSGLRIADDGLPRHEGERTKWKWPKLAESFNESVVVVLTEKGRGSGFIVDPRGLVVTNYHVVEGSYDRKGIEIKVLHRVGKEIRPVVYKDCVPTYLDAVIDIAIVEIRDKPKYPLRPVVLNPDDSYRTGDQVAAIGSPGTGAGEQLENSFSKGTISKKERDLHGANYIQMDVTINPGNSGGPIFSEYAEVVGMATWAYVERQKLNFAVRVADIRKAVLEHPFGSYDATLEEAAVREMLDKYWKAVAEKDLDTIADLLPSHLYEKEKDQFNRAMEIMRKRYEMYFELYGSSKEQMRKELEKEGPAAVLYFETVFAKKEGEEFTMEEIRDFHARMQLLTFEQARFKDYRINSVSLAGGAIGKFNVTMTLLDPTGKEERRSAVKQCVKDRGVWKIYASPLEASEEE